MRPSMIGLFPGHPYHGLVLQCFVFRFGATARPFNRGCIIGQTPQLFDRCSYVVWLSTLDMSDCTTVHVTSTPYQDSDSNIPRPTYVQSGIERSIYLFFHTLFLPIRIDSNHMQYTSFDSPTAGVFTLSKHPHNRIHIPYSFLQIQISTLQNGLHIHHDTPHAQ